jgi:hypothetical protein
MLPSRMPSFARAFPRSPDLDALVEAFARGDYASVRAHAPALERSSDDPAIQQAARTLVERTRPEPLAVVLLALAVLLLCVLAAWAIVHGKPPPPSESPPKTESPTPSREPTARLEPTPLDGPNGA